MSNGTTISKQTPVTIGIVIVIVLVAIGIAGTAGTAIINKDDIGELKKANYPTRD